MTYSLDSKLGDLLVDRRVIEILDKYLPGASKNPQIGMANMRTVMPALQKAKPVKLPGEGLTFGSVTLPKQQRQTRIVKDTSPDDIAKEIVEWIKK